MKNSIETPPKKLICFSHLRWDFVFQRPQHLLSRFSADTSVYFFEEPIFDAVQENYLSISARGNKLHVIVPHLCKENSDAEQITSVLSTLLSQFLFNEDLDEWMFWYYTPMALPFTDKFKPRLIIYDCMDELSAFKFAPAELVSLEKKLMSRADIVFTGGHSLYEVKKQQHSNIFPFPSSIDKHHFEKARKQTAEPEDQCDIFGPKIGFYGVIDERFDIELIREISEKRPEWQIVLIGPIVKIDEQILPKNRNIHYLGQKSYEELPNYLCSWDVALIPFILNESTRFISPTKTPEYLAAGIPVVSTPIRDVIKPYGINRIVHIGSNAEDFISSIETELNRSDRKDWLAHVDNFLKHISWDDTYAGMLRQIQNTMNSTRDISIAS